MDLTANDIMEAALRCGNRFGEDQVWIYDLWKAFCEKHEKILLKTFKEELIRLCRDEETDIELSCLDSPKGFPFNLVRNSTVKCEGATFHLMRLSEQSKLGNKRDHKVATYDGIDIRATRLRLGFSQHDLAERLGVTKMTIHRWEHGISKPSRRAIKQLKGISAADLFTHLVVSCEEYTGLSVGRRVSELIGEIQDYYQEKHQIR
jgi:DNA-binding transcriptional regulator YiaG